MASIDEIRSARLQKLDILKKAGINPYPAKVPRDFPITFLKTNFDAQTKTSVAISVAGRVMAIRGQGAILFAVLFDGTDRIQAIIKKDILKNESFALFTDTVDVGDFISVTGMAILSERGEPSVMADSWIMASKSLLPLPEKWHGLQDVEERSRKRYLDFVMNDELRDLILKKSKFWDATREFMKNTGFLEVETPTLETTTGGAEATPFGTHHNDFDLDVYLRISVGELWQKRLMAGGFPKTFEIGRVYRNEGSSPEHLQEFTNMEFYWSFADFNDGMELVREMYIQTATEEEMAKRLDELKVKYDGNNKERLMDTLWKYCRKNISGPAFLINHPKLISPLAKEKESNKGLTERFQILIAGAEIGNGYSELNDPTEQRARFKEQQRLLESGDEEAMMPDWEFVEMLEHGMPPTCGFGFGERLFAFMIDSTVREASLFPLMKPKISINY